MADIGASRKLWLVGYCDDIALLYREDLDEERGALSPATMVKVAAGLRIALAL